MQSPPEPSWSWPFRKTITGRISNQKLREVVVMQGWGEKVFAYSSSGVRPWAWNYFDRNNWRLRLRLCDQNPLSSLFVLHSRLLFVKKIINNWSSDLISDEFWAEAINISQWSETWLTKKFRKCLSKSNGLISRRVPTKTGIQGRRAEAALLIRNCIHKSLEELN